MQARESKIDYELDISGDPVDCDRVIVNDAIPASEAAMEAKITAIVTQHHRATIERRLTEAWLDCDCGFLSPNTVTDSHAKASNRQEDSTMIITGALAIDRAIYL